MITNERKDLFVRLVADGQNNIEQLNKCGFDNGTIKYLCSPAHAEHHIAGIVGNKIVLNPAGANRLYELQKQDCRNRKEKIILIATVVAAISGLASAIFLGIQTLGQH